jgi:hypothetical protein
MCQVVGPGGGQLTAPEYEMTNPETKRIAKAEIRAVLINTFWAE